MWIRLCKVLGLMIVVINIAGCAESSFDLAPESRLPKWFSVPSGMSRGDLEVTMDYYADGDVVFKLYSKDSIFRLEKVEGITRKGGPVRLKRTPPGFVEGRPVYEVVTVNGVIDIIEHRIKGPIFHLTDDPAVWNELGVEKK